MLSQVFVIVNKLTPEYIIYIVKDEDSTYNFRAERQAEIPIVNTTKCGLRSYRSEAAWVLNSLPNELRVAFSYHQLRRLSRS